MSLKKVVFLGSKPLGLRVLREIYALHPEIFVGVVTLDDSEDIRTALGEIRAFCQKEDLPFYLAENKKHSEEILKELSPDFCVVVGWYWLLSPQILETVPLGFLGVHYSLLPQYRGSSPLVWALINGEKEVGVSLFTLSNGMDEGSLWAQAKVSVGPNDSIGEVLEKLEEKTLGEMRRVYPGILEGSLSSWNQKESGATYCSPRSPRDGNIHWRSSAHKIYDFIRAQSHPYPGAFSFLGGEKITIWRVSLFEHPYFGPPGKLVPIKGHRRAVICGDHRCLVLEEVEVSGKKGSATTLFKGLPNRFFEKPDPLL